MSLSIVSQTRLRPPWHWAGRSVWVALVALSVTFFVIGAINQADALLLPASETTDPFEFSLEDLEVARDHGITTGLLTSGILQTLIILTANLTYFVVALWIFWRRSDDWMVMLLSGTLAVLGGVLFTNLDDAVARTYPSVEWLLRSVSRFGGLGLVLLLYLFPDGKFVPRWTVFLVVPILVILAADVGEFVPGLLRLLMIAPLLLMGLYARVYRYRRESSSIQRQQTKWIGFGLSGAVGVILLVIVAFAFFPVESPGTGRLYFLLAIQPFLMFFLLLLPVSVAIAIPRYRLWDIDLLVNRTMVYGPLTGILLGLYIAAIRLIQTLFVRFSGQESDLAILLSTLVLAGAFMPLRLWLQALADRFFKEVPDPTKGLAAFNNQVRTTVQLTNTGQITRRLLDEVVAAFHAESGAVYLKEGEQMLLVQTAGAWSDDAQVSVPVVHEGTQLGLVSLGARQKNLPYGAQEHAALLETAEVAAQALSLSLRVG